MTTDPTYSEPVSFTVIPLPVKGGKTTKAENLAVHYADRQDRPTLYIDSERRTPDFLVSFGEKLHQSKGRDLSDVPLWFLPCMLTSFESVLKNIREWVSMINLADKPCVIIDYLQCEEGSTLEEMLDKLKALTTELKITMVVMTQTNRPGSTQTP